MVFNEKIKRQCTIKDSFAVIYTTGFTTKNTIIICKKEFRQYYLNK